MAALSVRSDGEADHGRHDDEVDHHVSGCDRCQAFVASIERVRAELRVTAADGIDVRERVLDRLGDAPNLGPRLLGQTHLPLGRVAAFALAGAAALLVAFLVGRGSAPQPLETIDPVGSQTPADQPGLEDRPAPTPQPSAADPVDAPGDAPPAALGVVWTAGRLDPAVTAAIAGLADVESTTVARATAELTGSRSADGRTIDRLDDGWVVPIDTIAVEPDRYGRLVDADAIERLQPGQAVMSEAAALRRDVGPGDLLTFAEVDVEVVATVPSATIGGAELAVETGTGASLGVATARYELVRFTGSPDAMAARIERSTERPLRFRTADEISVLRSNDRIMTMAELKDELGEFSYRRTPAGVEVDEDWRQANIRTVEIDGLGEVTCHRKVIPLVVAALESAPSADPVSGTSSGSGGDLSSFAGCFYPRTIAGSTELSRHSWGGAIDFGWREAEPAEWLIDAMIGQGFSWGGDWLLPDGGHFEFTGRTN